MDKHFCIYYYTDLGYNGAHIVFVDYEMTAQWYELKSLLQLKIKEAEWPMSTIGLEIILIKMNEIESKHACQSLKEVGY